MDGGNNPITIKMPQKHEIPFYWQMILPWVEKSVEYTAGCYLAIDIYRQVLMGEFGLWLVMDGERPIAFALTKVEKTPRRWLFSIPYLAGERMDEWAAVMQDHLEKAAKALGCDGMSGGGREGWRKFGFRKTGVWLVKDI